MPTFYFDVYDGETALRDQFGCEMDSLAEATEQADALLPDLARDDHATCHVRNYATFVRDSEGLPVYRAALLLRGELLRDDDEQKPTRKTRLDAVLAESRETRERASRLSASIRSNVSDLLTIIEQSTLMVEQVQAAAITRGLG